MKPLAAVVAALLAFANLPLAEGQTLAADYQVQDTFSSSVGSIGPLVPIGEPGGVEFITDTVNGNTQRVLNLEVIDDMSVPPNSIDSGVQTQTNPFVDSSNFSIVLLASFNLDAAAIVATKIFDFKNLSSDAGLYVNGGSGTLAFIDGSGVLQAPPGGVALTSLAYTQIVLTRNGVTDLVSVYVDGALAFSFTDTMDLAVLGDSSMSGNSFLTLFKDDGGGLAGSLVNEGTQGNIARLRLYDGVLTPEQVAALDTVVPEPSTWLLCSLGALLIGIKSRRQRV